MADLNVSQEKVNSASAALFIISLAVLNSIDGVRTCGMLLLSTGLAIVLRQFLLSRLLDMIIASLIFGGSWLVVQYRFATNSFVALLLGIGALYFIGLQCASSLNRSPS